jgi:anti-sigma regulatory factor (Ser/Thr protein kinase)
MLSTTGSAVFSPVPRSITEARHFAVAYLAEIGCPYATVETAALLVSELAANAVHHAATTFSVALMLTDHTLTVVVVDQGSGDVVVQDPAAEGGHGLALVEALADSWGVRPQHPGKSVYFQLSC